jgi:hypothetical protein
VETESTHWRDRARANPYGVCPLVIVTRGWVYDDGYRLGADGDMALFQDWLYQQVGKTIRVVPAVRIDSLKTAEEHAAGTYTSTSPISSAAHRNAMARAANPVDFCNSKRHYVLYSTGDIGLANMAGRQAFNCPPDLSNPLAVTHPDGRREEWGLARAGGPSAWAMDLVAGTRLRTHRQHGMPHEGRHCMNCFTDSASSIQPKPGPMPGIRRWPASGTFPSTIREHRRACCPTR